MLDALLKKKHWSWLFEIHSWIRGESFGLFQYVAFERNQPFLESQWEKSTEWKDWGWLQHICFLLRCLPVAGAGWRRGEGEVEWGRFPPSCLFQDKIAKFMSNRISLSIYHHCPEIPGFDTLLCISLLTSSFPNAFSNKSLIGSIAGLPHSKFQAKASNVTANCFRGRQVWSESRFQHHTFP